MYRDELQGFAKSRVMPVLWVGMPVVVFLIHALQPQLEGQMSLTVFATLIVTSMASSISALLLSVGIIHEKSRGVYALFLVRPVRRRAIVLGKFFAVFTCVALAALITIAVGLAYDWLRGGRPGARALLEVATSAVTGLATVSITSAAGVLVGVLSPTVLVGVILVLYGASQLSVLAFLPVLLNLQPAWPYALGGGIAATILLLALAVAFFERKQF